MGKIKYKLVLSLILIFLSFILLFNYLNERIYTATISLSQLTFLDKISFFTTYQSRLAHLNNSENNIAWLHLAKLYSDIYPSVSYALANYYKQHEQPYLAQLYYKKAIRQGVVAARINLAEYLYAQNDIGAAKSLLQPIKNEVKALALLYIIALQVSDIDFIKKHQKNLKRLSDDKFYNELEGFSVFDFTKTSVLANNYAKHTCKIDVQLVATDIQGLRHGKALIKQFTKSKLSSLVCLQYPKYIPLKDLQCQHKKKERISCQAKLWENYPNITSRYIAVIVKQGGANVDNGIMYLDQQDTLDVFIHELSHFLGFIDEYPLNKNHAACNENYRNAFAHNVVLLPKTYSGNRTAIRQKILKQIPWGALIKNTTPILMKKGKKWLLSTPATYQTQLGVFPARTCEFNDNFLSFKAIYRQSKLEYFELDFPKEYIDIYNLAADKYLMPSYQFNMRQDLETDIYP